MTAALTVLRGGPLTTVQDAGRTGYAHLGVPTCGPADWVRHELANRLVDNPPGAAALELTVAGPALRAAGACTVAVVADAPVRVGDEAVAPGRTVRLSPGDVLDVGQLRSGVRGYVAVAGGVHTAATLGSRCTDLLSGLGPPQLRAGDVLPLLDVPAPAERRLTGRLPSGDVVRAVPGPHDDWFTADTVAAFYAADWTVTPASDRVGMHLSGPSLPRTVPDELQSEGVLTGTVQVTGDAQPLVLMAGHGSTGGYPVIATAASADVPVLAQLRPGQRVRFVRCDVDSAMQAGHELRRWLAAAVQLV